MKTITVNYGNWQTEQCVDDALYDAIYNKGRADAIDEFVNECMTYEDLTFDKSQTERIKMIADELKEQNK